MTHALDSMVIMLRGLTNQTGIHAVAFVGPYVCTGSQRFVGGKGPFAVGG